MSDQTTKPSRHMGFTELVFSDLQVYRPNESPTWPRVLARCLVLPGLAAGVLLRAQQHLFESGQVRLAFLLRIVGVVMFSADFFPGAQVGASLYLPHPMGVTIGGGLQIGNSVTILQGVTAGILHPTSSPPGERTVICDGAIVCANAVLVGEVRVGRNALVGANSVVLSDVPDSAVVFGIPARQSGATDSDSPMSPRAAYIERIIRESSP
ncbi:MAG: hypothetical protein DLM57_02710 [Pseudonocardiales bacterium]|nr:MAG: hypothetical protein DLM57_02710 [Pseudonocardiales bacterium]